VATVKKSGNGQPERTLYFDPPALLRWMPKDKPNRVLFIDLEPDFPDENTLRMELNILFRPIPVKRRRQGQKKDYYVGSTGARITFWIPDGKPKKWFRAARIPVDYEQTYTQFRKAAVKIAPEIEIAEAAKLRIGEVSFEAGKKYPHTSKFSGSEQDLKDSLLGNGVEWQFVTPERGALRDYAVGNIFLFVESSCASGKVKGWVTLRPSDVIFFDSKHRRIGSGLKAIGMQFTLWKQGIQVDDTDLTINFTERK
jgi:hypothetical protein